MNLGGRAVVVAGGLAAVLTPLLVIPAVRAREEAPERPGLDAICPPQQAGGGTPFSFPATTDDAAARAEALAQPVPADGGPATFTLGEGSAGELGGAGSGSGSGSGIGGTGASSGTGAGSGGGAGGTGGGSGATTGPGTGPGAGMQPGTTVGAPTPPTVPPEEVAAEVVEEEQPDDDRAAFPWPVLLLLLLAAAVGAALALARRRTSDAAAGTGEAAPGTRRARARRVVDDDLEARVREAFLAGLYQLDRAGVVPYDESLPSARVARRLRAGRARNAFRRASAAFDEVAYGRRPPTPQHVERIESSFTEVLADR